VKGFSRRGVVYTVVIDVGVVNTIYQRYGSIVGIRVEEVVGDEGRLGIIPGTVVQIQGSSCGPGDAVALQFYIARSVLNR